LPIPLWSQREPDEAFLIQNVQALFSCIMLNLKGLKTMSEAGYNSMNDFSIFVLRNKEMAF